MKYYLPRTRCFWSSTNRLEFFLPVSYHFQIIQKLKSFNNHRPARFTTRNIRMILDAFQEKLRIQKSQANTLHQLHYVNFPRFGRGVYPPKTKKYCSTQWIFMTEFYLRIVSQTVSSLLTFRSSAFIISWSSFNDKFNISLLCAATWVKFFIIYFQQFAASSWQKWLLANSKMLMQLVGLKIDSRNWEHSSRAPSMLR